MKTKAIFRFLLMLCICIATAKNNMAQQQPNAGSANQVVHQTHNGQSDNYSMRVFLAPNKTYGYDIFNNGKLIYHQPAFSRVPNNKDVMITKQEQANTAAMLAIEKIRKGENPELSHDELKAITAH